MKAVFDWSLGACFMKAPKYPAAALGEGMEGRTLVTFLLNAEGAPADPGLLRSSGHPMLDNAALVHLNTCIKQFGEAAPQPLPQGRYALPMLWRIE